MRRYTKDDINFHGYLAALRDERRKSLRAVSKGLYSPTMISRVEAGERLPKKLERERLIARLGVSGEGYEDYLSQDEYDEWVIRQNILESVQAKDAEKLEKMLAEYKPEGKVEKQFFEAMRFMLLKMQHAPEEELRESISLAVSYTIPELEQGFLRKRLLADQEINLLIEYVRLQNCGDTETERRHWRLDKYHEISRCIDISCMNDIGKSKVYTKLVYYFCQEHIHGQGSVEELQASLSMCNEAIEILRRASRTYYMVELLEMRQCLIAQLLDQKQELAEEETKELRGLADTSKEWAEFFRDLYAEYKLSPYMEDFSYLYRETESHGVNDVIRLRRPMVELTQVHLAGDTCCSKTIRRIENEKVNPQMYEVRGIFEAMGLCPEYIRNSVITTDASLLKLRAQVTNYGNDRNYAKWRACLDELESNICMDIPQNQQIIMRERALLEEGEQKITRQEAVDRLMEALAVTVRTDKMWKLKKWYFTKEEITCLYNAAMFIDSSEENKYMELLIRFVEGEIAENRMIHRLGVHEILLTGIANYLGNIGEYEKSNAYADMVIRMDLQEHRMYGLSYNLYNNCWNKHHIAGGNAFPKGNQEVDTTLRRCILLSDITYCLNHRKFYVSKLEN